MSIFWERCSVCGRHRPLKQCWLHPERSVCPYCCIACPERSVCERPAWYPSIKAAVPRRGHEAGKAQEVLEELLRRLEGG